VANDPATGDAKTSMWVEGVEPAPKAAAKAPAKTPFENEFGPALGKMPPVVDVTKEYRKRQSKT
jgi:hypothetical protein